MTNKIHTIIFDLDGTLSDSGILTLAAMETVAPQHGLPVPTMEDIRKATGHPNPVFYYILFPDSDKDMIYKMGQQVEREEEGMLSATKDKLLFPGCRELLHGLKEMGIRLCIASTGDHDHVHGILNATGIIDLFDRIECGRPDKFDMLREMTRDGEKAGYIMVGDMMKDSEGARANGIVSVGACYGYCKRELGEFDYYIDAPRELMDIIDKLEKDEWK